MSYRKEFLTAAGTLTCALGIGFIMQSGDAARERYAKDEPVESKSIFLPPPAKLAVVGTAREGSPGPVTFFTVQDITLTSAEVDPVGITIAPDSPISAPRAPSSDLIAPALPERAVTDATPSNDCGLGLIATPADAAMVDLTLTAPCDRNAEVTISHSGISFDARTGADGRLQLSVPAMDDTASFEARLSTGKTISVTTDVPGLDVYDRMVLLTSARDGLHLHAREFGADYGSDGHVWAEASGKAGPEGGFMTSLGDTAAGLGRQVEIYTIAHALKQDPEDVAVTVETQIDTSNCGRDARARLLSRGAGGSQVTTDVALSIPGCDSVGGFLVLNYPLQDLTVAAR